MHGSGNASRGALAQAAHSDNEADGPNEYQAASERDETEEEEEEEQEDVNEAKQVGL